MNVMNRLFTMLMTWVGERRSAPQAKEEAPPSALVLDAELHVSREAKTEHWSQVCRTCDRVGARCLWCIAGFG